ncbi:MAG: hypothetical protein TR69_WS6001001224 [candidate division WS6 bacterium OLB20]|uniref:DUF11 domain-containing protein n=1 Tax=candidate division WS6 bacterium OLB20 TaxID=1617426 RepID=A0A136LX55_9BACT|nr:MAG: hypothetical protein TR69_WS6001001224 [candidate division WS6 bacterium OLB20]
MPVPVNTGTCTYPGGQWQSELTIPCGDYFEVGIFHNNDFSVLAEDAAPLLYDEDGDPAFPSNGLRLKANSETAATYTLHAYTLGADLDSPQCTDTAIVRCTAPVITVNSGDADTGGQGGGRVLGADSDTELTVTKTVDSPRDPFEVGNRVHYTITIRNDGDETLTGLAMTDEYPSSRLALERIVYGSNEEITGSFSVNNSTGTVTIADLTPLFSDLEPGEQIRFRMEFIATAAGQNVCNSVSAAGFSDTACIRIIEKPPVTDL